MEDGICTIPRMFHLNHAKINTTKIRIISNQDCYLRIINGNYGLDWFVLTHPRSLLHNYMPLTLTLLICFYSLRFVNVMWTMGKCCLVSTMRWTSFTITNIRRTARQVPPPPPFLLPTNSVYSFMYLSCGLLDRCPPFLLLTAIIYSHTFTS